MISKPISVMALEELINPLLGTDNLQLHFQKFNQQYKNEHFTYQNPMKVLLDIKKIQEKNKSSSTDEQLNFKKGEGQIFHWIVAVYCYWNNIMLEGIDERHCEALQKMFPFKKSSTMIKYKIGELMRAKNKGKGNSKQIWSQQQDNLLSEIIKQAKVESISFELFKQSNGKFFRSSVQCKERWKNHLNRDKRSLSWSQKEDKKLLEAVLKFGKRWRFISIHWFHYKKTDHNVKNRFNKIIKQMKNSKNKMKKSSLKKIIQKKLNWMKKQAKKREDIENTQIIEPEKQENVRVSNVLQHNREDQKNLENGYEDNTFHLKQLPHYKEDEQPQNKIQEIRQKVLAERQNNNGNIFIEKDSLEFMGLWEKEQLSAQKQFDVCDI